MDEKSDQWSLPDDAKQILLERFKVLKEKVVLEVFTAKTQENPFDSLTVTFTQALGALNDKIEVRLNNIGDKKSGTPVRPSGKKADHSLRRLFWSPVTKAICLLLQKKPLQS